MASRVSKEIFVWRLIDLMYFKKTPEAQQPLLTQSLNGTPHMMNVWDEEYSITSTARFGRTKVL